MKQTITILILILVSIQAKAQTVSENDSLYLVALERYAIEINSFYSRYSSDSDKYQTIYIEKTTLIDNLPKIINGYKVTVLTVNNWKKIYRKNNKELIHLKLFPIEIENGLIEVTLIPYHGKLKKRKDLHLDLSSWTKVYFKQDCKNGKWRFLKTENGGI